MNQYDGCSWIAIETMIVPLDHVNAAKPNSNSTFDAPAILTAELEFRHGGRCVPRRGAYR